MSWQDELQQLDSALASGQISADEYRIRRDRAIAQASGQSAPDQQQGPVGEATQVVRPVSPPHGERTQIVPPVGGADRTQVVSGHDTSSDNTQVVPGGQAAGHQPQFPPPPPPPPWETGHPQQQQQPQPQQQQNMAAPPWGGEDSLPPEFGQQSWPTQGPEVFEESGSGNTGRVVAIVVAAVLVLGLIGAGVWYFGFNKSGDDDGDNKTQAQSTPEKTKETPEKPDIPEGPFIELTGDLGGKINFNATRSRDEAIAASSPSKADVPIIQNNPDVESVSGLVADDEAKNRVGIWAFKVADDGDPAALLQAIDQVYEQAGFVLAQEDGLFVRSLQNTANGTPMLTIRAHYVTEDGYVVRLESFGADLETVQSRFDTLKTEMLDKYPSET